MPRTALLAISALAIATSAAAIEPGEWRSTTQMIDIQLPGNMPPQVAQMMSQTMGNAMSNSQCITQQDIDEAPEELFQQTDGECRYTSFEMAGGVIDAVAQCNMDEGEMTMQMTGTYTDTAYDMQMTMQGDMGMGAMTMTYQTTGQRIGACG